MTLSAKLLVLTLCLTCIFLCLPASAAALPPTIHETLATALWGCQAEVDVAAYNITTSEIGGMFAEVLHEHPTLFHVENHFSYRYNAAGTVLTVYPAYCLTGKALADARVVYQSTVEHLCAAVDPTWSEADKALYLHDILAATYAYDTDEKNYTASDLFTDGVGVCQAYAMAYMALGQAVGLAVDLVYSDAMNHAWNHVRVDGAWYHVDVTRDDPVEGNSSVVKHTRLLRSDAGMAAWGYTAYTCAGKHICNDTRFEAFDGQAKWMSLEVMPRRIGGIWCFQGADHTLIPLSLTAGKDGRPVIYANGDITADGTVSVDDLLALRRMELTAAPISEEALDRLRARILEIMSATPCILPKT